jgi:Bacterial PH domain
MLDVDAEMHRLLSERPASHAKGTFPREYLPTGEVVLFETRPSLSPLLLLGIVLILLASLLGVLIILNASILAASTGLAGLAGAYQFLAILVIIATVVGIVIALHGWYNTAYVLTNRRVIRKSGSIARRIVDARLDRIQAVTLTEHGGFKLREVGTLLFSLSATSVYGSRFSGLQQGGILWFGIPGPVAVRAFTEDVIETFAMFDRLGIRPSLQES